MVKIEEASSDEESGPRTYQRRPDVVNDGGIDVRQQRAVIEQMEPQQERADPFDANQMNSSIYGAGKPSLFSNGVPSTSDFLPDNAEDPFGTDAAHQNVEMQFAAAQEYWGGMWKSMLQSIDTLFDRILSSIGWKKRHE
uniref:Uncharacterized protein n=1 Tax=Palpitomonas bilix TaxID=652834 RepID=A0A7S3DGZ7_9EUKA|mmetsp:Transcript_37441/g.96714  ORF Transcript_37441/g.96714 Transcript_37441/m.96714 type:complete len:139 (+) Transcript_37441:218-634(+)